MKFVAVLLVACMVCTTQANLAKILNIVVPHNSINNAIIDMLENMRINFPCGFPDYNIPILEPLAIPDYDFIIDGGAASHIDMHMRSVLVHGLDRFIINSVDFNILRLNFDFDFTFPVLTLRGTHRTTARIAGTVPVPIVGDGPFSMVLRGTRAIGHVSLSIRGGFLSMDNIILNIALDSADTNINGFGGALIERAINNLISDAIPAVVNQEQDGLNEMLREMIMGPANEVLNQMTLSDLIDLINSSGGGGSSGPAEKRC